MPLSLKCVPRGKMPKSTTCPSGADPGFCQGGWLAGPKKFSRRPTPRKIFGALVGGSGGMLPQKIFKTEIARLA